MALTVAELLAKITLEVSGGISGAAEFQAAITAATEQLNQFTAAALEANGQIAGLGNAAEQSGNSLSNLTKSSNAAAGSMGTMAGIVSGKLAGGLNLLGGIGIATAVKFLGVAGAAYELTKGLEDSVKEAISWGEEVRKIQIISDLSAQKASDLGVAFMYVGLNTAVAVRALALFENHIHAGTGKITEYFTATELVNMHNQTLAQMIPELQAKFQSLNSHTEKLAFTIGVFGTRIGPQMLNWLALTKDELAALTEEARRNGLELGQGQVDSAHAAQLAMNSLSMSFKAAEVALGQELMPVFIQIMKELQIFIATVTMAAKIVIDFSAAVGHAFAGMWDALTGNMAGFHNQQIKAQESINSLKKDSVEGWNAIKQAAQGHSTAVSDALNAEAQASKALSDQQRVVADMERKNAEAAVTHAHSIEKAREALLTQQRAYNRFIEEEPIKIWVDEVNAIKSVFDAQLKVVDQQKVLNDLLAGPTAEASQKAIDAVDNAVVSLFDNQQKVIAAQKALNDVMNPPQRTKDKAAEDVAKAQVGVEKATAAVLAAEKNLAIVRGYGASSAVQIHDAEIALKEAKFGATDASWTLVDAETALRNLRVDAIPGSAAYIAAQNALKLAQDSVKDSTNAIVTSQKALNDLSPTSVAGARAIAQAQMDLVAAEAAVYTQVMNASDAVRNATDFMNGGLAATIPYKDETNKLKDAQYAVSQALWAANDAIITQGEQMDVARTKLNELTASYHEMQAAAAQAAAQVAQSENPKSQSPPGTYNWNAIQMNQQQAALRTKLVSEGVDLTMLNPAVLQSQAWIDFLNSPQGLAWAHQQGLHHDGGIQGPKQHGGGLVRMHGGGMARDEVSRVLQIGEFIMNKQAVAGIGIETMAAINSTGQLPRNYGGGDNSGGGVANVTIPIYLDGRQIATTVRQIFIADRQTGRVSSLGF